MKRIVFVLLFLFWITGCASALESTPSPEANPPQQVSPAAQGAATLLPPPPSKCQSKITGRVVNAQDAPIKGATVQIKSGSFTAKTVSDDNGLYGFAGLCGGTFTFTVQPAGQPAKPVSATATVDGNNSAKVDLTFK
jgi:carboxypeptidase family protein